MFNWHLLPNSYSETWSKLARHNNRKNIIFHFQYQKLFHFISEFLDLEKNQSFQRICCCKCWKRVWIYLWIILVMKQKRTHQPSNKNLNKKAQDVKLWKKHTFGWTSLEFFILPIPFCRSTLSKSRQRVPCDLCDNAIISLANFSIKLCKRSSNFVNYDISQLAGTISQPL